MKDLENLPEEVFDLLQNKKESDLNPAEIELLSEFIDIKDYDLYRELILEFQDLDQAMVFDRSMPDFEKEPIQEEPKSRKFPVYRMAAGFLVLVFAALTIWDLDPQNPSDPDPIVIEDQMEEGMAIDPQLIEMQLQNMQQAVEVNNQKLGTSLANENYPEDLVIEFGAGMMPGEGLRSRY